GTAENGAPKLVSSFPTTIETLVYQAADGSFWKTPEKAAVAPGSPVPLEAIEKDAHKEWITEISGDFSDRMRKRIRFLASEPGRFFAKSSKASDLYLETHSGIDWETETLLISGNVLTNGSEPTPPAATETSTPPALNE
ncbi:MAG: hypothetical protein MI807_08680, partial [Verrucomicrobiales bacterium]|nr:hypothetical protein [Verrucomicrobiales bacterium]